MSRSNGFSKYPGSEIAVFWQRLNDWVEHLARQYVLFGREVSVQTQNELFRLDQLSETERFQFLSWNGPSTTSCPLRLAGTL